jgi:hypothetical protein
MYCGSIMKDLKRYLLPGLLFTSLLYDCFDASAQSMTELFSPIESKKSSDLDAEQLHRFEKIRDLPTTESLEVLHVNTDAKIGSELKIPMPGGKKVTIVRNGGETIDSGNFTWTGAVQGEDFASASLIARDGEITGSINSHEGLFRISPLGEGAYALVKVSPRRFPPDEPSSNKPNR